MIVCIDTNVVLGMVGRSGPWLPLRHALMNGKLMWAVSTEILLEYEEVTAREISMPAATQMMRFIELLDQTRGNIRLVSPAFRFRLIRADPDDDKFADCAVTAEADYIITNDRHFAAMTGQGYKPQPISPEEFLRCHFGEA